MNTTIGAGGWEVQEGHKSQRRRNQGRFTWKNENFPSLSCLEYIHPHSNANFIPLWSSVTEPCGILAYVSHFGLGVLFIRNSISLLVIGLFKLSVSSWFSLGRLYGSRSLFLLICPICWHITVHSILLWFFSVMASCSFNSQHLTILSIYLFINYRYTPSGYKIHEGRGSDYLNKNCMMRS